MDSGLVFMFAVFAYCLWIGIGIGTFKEKMGTFIFLSILILVVGGFLWFIGFRNPGGEY